jgi:hypothetical protein
MTRLLGALLKVTTVYYLPWELLCSKLNIHSANEPLSPKNVCAWSSGRRRGMTVIGKSQQGMHVSIKKSVAQTRQHQEIANKMN